MKQPMTAERAREVFDYDPDTGVVRWKIRIGARLKNWNTRFAHKAAGYLHHAGYIMLRVDSHLYLAHRVAWLLSRGHWPDNEIDHINGDRSDNRLVNLRAAARFENMRNAKVKSISQSGLKGALTGRRSATFYSLIRAGGKRVYLGNFATAEEAHAAYVAAATELHGEFVRNG